MDMRKQGLRSAPAKACDFVTKRELSECRGLPPPIAPKINKRLSQKSLFQEKGFARAVFFKTPVHLSHLYRPNLDQSYLDQVFTKDATIGEGSFGTVFRSTSKEDNRVYAVKQLKYPHYINYGYAEVENYEKIGEHNNFVRFIMAWEELKLIHIQMEYCSQSLAQYATTVKTILESQLWEILYDMLNALDYLHTKKFIHLDVKPGNILMSNGFYKLADFGLLVDLNKHDGSKISTISDGDAKYLACEVLDGVYTYSCDIFGLGISLLELATNIELPEFGTLWHQIRKPFLPAVFYQCVTRHFALTVEQMMAAIHFDRPQASTLLKQANLSKIRKQDLKQSRTNYSMDTFITENCNYHENNNIVETPKRPLHDVRYSLSVKEFYQRESTSTAVTPSRRGLSRVKLTF